MPPASPRPLFPHMLGLGLREIRFMEVAFDSGATTLDYLILQLKKKIKKLVDRNMNQLLLVSDFPCEGLWARCSFLYLTD